MKSCWRCLSGPLVPRSLLHQAEGSAPSRAGALGPGMDRSCAGKAPGTRSHGPEHLAAVLVPARRSCERREACLSKAPELTSAFDVSNLK